MWALALLLLSACKCNSGEAEWNLANGEACLSCHVGIEDAHPGFEGECTVCHGGNGSSTVLADAHVPVPNDWAEIRGSLPQAPDGFIKDPHELHNLASTASPALKAEMHEMVLKQFACAGETCS